MPPPTAGYGLLQALTGVRYDAVDKTLYMDSKIGDDFTTFLGTETGFGTVGMKNDTAFVNPVFGYCDIQHVIVR